MVDFQSAAQWMGKLLVEEAQYLYKVEDKVNELKDELEWIQFYLRDADACQHDSYMTKKWVAQVREFSYRAEDTIEKYLLRVATSNRGLGTLKTMLCKLYSVFKEAKVVHEISNDIEALKRKISLLSSKQMLYNIRLKMESSSVSWLSKDRHTTYHSCKKKIVIGRKKELGRLINELVRDKKVVSICGMGGVGKSFLAETLFQHLKINRNFEAFAWAYVSKPSQSIVIQQDILRGLTSKSEEQIALLTYSELKNELFEFQCKHKCLIVLDGIWEKKVWDSLKDAFPVLSSKYRSKLLITTRDHEVAKYVFEDAFIEELHCLNKKCSKSLLDVKLKDNVILFTQGVKDKMKDIISELLEHCEGLPLAISLLGGVLSAKKTLEELLKVEENVNSYVKMVDGSLVPRWKGVLELSYYDLPYHLKPSFLYLGYFPANLEIHTRKITRLWEAEGRVSFGDDEMFKDMTIGDVAERCLAELVERSMVTVGSRIHTGRAKTCILHDLVQDLCTAKVSRGKWFNFTEFPVQNNPQSFNSKYNSTQAKFTRSLFYFTLANDGDVSMNLKHKVLRQSFERYRMLRVLDIEYIEVHSLPEEVGYLVHLRYLSLRGSWISWLPPTIKNLKCLQALDLRVLSFISVDIPNVLWKMARLVHLFLPSKRFLIHHHHHHSESQLKLSNLKHLQTLSNFSYRCRVKDIEGLHNLRRFSSCDFLKDVEGIMHLFDDSSSLEHLKHVSLRLDGEVLKTNHHAIRRCYKLHKLWVKGSITDSLGFDMLPENLTVLSFHESKFLSRDPMEVLGKLPFLKKLSLKHDSYLGEDMKCSKGEFQELEHLILEGLKRLQVWTVEDGAMSKLSNLMIYDCPKLKMLPDGLEYVQSLKELSISFMPFSFFNWKNPTEDIEEWAQYPKVKHVPCINVSYVLDIVDKDFPIEKPGCQGLKV